MFYKNAMFLLFYFSQENKSTLAQTTKSFKRLNKLLCNFVFQLIINKTFESWFFEIYIAY